MSEENRPGLSTRQEQAKLKRHQAEAQKRVEYERLIQDINTTFATEEGIRTLRWLMNECGFMESNIVFNGSTLEINEKSVLYNEMRRALYLRIRSMVRPETLRKVEHEGII